LAKTFNSVVMFKLKNILQYSDKGTVEIQQQRRTQEGRGQDVRQGVAPRKRQKARQGNNVQQYKEDQVSSPFQENIVFTKFCYKLNKVSHFTR